MNKIYKVIKNRFGQNLVASELARGKGKSKKLSLLLKTALVGAVSFGFSGMALADIVINNSEDVLVTKAEGEQKKLSIRNIDENITVNNTGHLTSNVDEGQDLLYYFIKNGNVDLTNSGTLETHNEGTRGIMIWGSPVEQERVIKVTNHGNININGDAASGIVVLGNDVARWATSPDSNTTVFVDNTGDITVKAEKWKPNADLKAGRAPTGIIATALSGNNGDINIKNSGNIISAHTGMQGWQEGIGDVNIDNYGDVHIYDSPFSSGFGIIGKRDVVGWKDHHQVSKGDINIRNHGKLSTASQKNNINLIHAYMTISSKGEGIVEGNINIDNDGVIQSDGKNAKGIYASMRGSAGNTGKITINNNSLVDISGEDSKSIYAFSRDGDINVNLDAGSKIIGGNGKDGAAVEMISEEHRLDVSKETQALQILNNKGEISASNDRTIVAHRSRASGGQTIINNDGKINGFVDLSATENLNLAKTDLTADQNFQDVKSNGEVQFNNNGLWNIQDATGLSSNGQVGTVINVIGTDSKNGLINNTGTIQIVDPDINSAVLQNADVINSGIIDLGKNSADTTLTINGNYNGDNGQVNIYTDVENNLTDKLIITGNANGNTQLDIIEIGDADVEEGRIEDFIHVQGKDDAKWTIKENNDSGFDYTIDRDQNGKLVINYTNAFSNVLKSPVSGSVFANQMASLGMFRHTAQDRAAAVYAPDSNVWMRSSYNREKTDLFNGRQKVEIKTTVLEMGVDVVSTDDFKAGVYGGYGHSSTDTDLKNSQRKGDGSVSGYNVGFYGHWNNQDNGAGLYVDGWAQYSWFNNKTNVHLSDVRNFHNKYDSHAISLSAEAGYGFVVHEGSNKKWLIEPHVQLGYTWTDADDFNLNKKGRVTDINADGAQIRLGASFYGKNSKETYGVLPFVEANWLYDSSTPEAKLNGKHVKSDVSKNQFEVKVGLNANFSKALTGYAQFDGKFGSNSHSNVGAKIGLNYSF